MSSIFNPDNVFFRIVTKVCHVFFLSLIWLICSLPIVTIGASAAAINTVMLRMVRDEEGYLIRSFFKAFKANFKQSTIIWLMAVAAFIILAADLYFFARMGNWLGTICAGLFFAVIFVMGLALMLIFHYQVWFENPTKVTVINTFRTALGYLPYSVALLILFVAMFYGIYVSVPLMIFFTFFGAGIFSYISAYLWRRVFDKILITERKDMKQ